MASLHRRGRAEPGVAIRKYPLVDVVRPLQCMSTPMIGRLAGRGRGRLKPIPSFTDIVFIAEHRSQRWLCGQEHKSSRLTCSQSAKPFRSKSEFRTSTDDPFSLYMRWAGEVARERRGDLPIRTIVAPGIQPSTEIPRPCQRAQIVLPVAKSQ